MNTRKPKPTMREIASSANVSIATVSKYINKLQRFTPDVEARIQAAIDERSYQLNPLARSMSTGQTMVVGVVIMDIQNPHFTGIVKGANRVAVEAGYSVMFADTTEGERQVTEKKLVEDMAMRVDGLVVSSRLSEGAIQRLADLHSPVVFFGRLGRPDIHSVSSNGYKGAFMLGRHLVELGHRRIAFVGFPASRWNTERLKGLSDAFAESQCSLSVFEVQSSGAEAGESIASAVLLGGEHFDAVIGYNDLIAIGLMHAAQTFGLKIPEQVSIAGFDNILYGRYTTPSLTTVDLFSEALGELAMTRLLQCIKGELKPFDEALDPRLVTRASTRQRGSDSL
jgi:DNA-binding LacI/PurR family transcriptional regulator